MKKCFKQVFLFAFILILALGMSGRVMADSFGHITNYDLIVIPPLKLDISGDFTDPVFKQCVWEWLGNTGDPGYFTKKDITDKIASGAEGLTVVNKDIKSLNGIEHFVGLESLHCYSLKLKELPEQLPESLLLLSCWNNEITSLPELPPNLSVLQCGNNKLSALPKMPSSLIELSCAANNISQLPELPTSMAHLFCVNNKLQSLPQLPPQLISLYCGNNNLTGLPALPPTLDVLDIHNNPIKSLPALPSSLFTLDCSSCLLSSLPELPNTMVTLNCEYNFLNVFEFPLDSIMMNNSMSTTVYTPQYRVAYTGPGITLEEGLTKQIADGEIKKQMSSDGVIWGDTAGFQISELTFSSSDNAVAKVDSAGLITAVGKGSCVITVMYGGVDAPFMKTGISVTVKEKTVTDPEPEEEPEEPPAEKPVDYLSASSWAISELEQAEKYGLFTDAVKDDLTSDITRAEFCGIAVKLYEALTGSTAVPVAVNPFIDTNDPNILKAYNLRIVNGVSENRFAPDNNITRQEICVMIVRALKASIPGLNTAVTGVGPFADEDLIASWAINEVRFANKNGIMNGTGGNMISPLDNSQRQVAIILIKRTYEAFKSPSV